MKELSNHILTESKKREICAWEYPGPYAIYNLPPYEQMRQQQMGFCHPVKAKNYRAWYWGAQPVGFTNLKEEEQAVFLGIGVAPGSCNQGYGSMILEECYQLSRQLFPGKPLYLEVRTWNERAVRCYQRSGFQIEGEPFSQETDIGPGTFFRMVRR